MLRRAASSLLASCSSSSSPAACSRCAASLPTTVSDKDMPTITEGRQAFDGDLRSTSALGTGDGIFDHTGKWLQGHSQAPIDMLREEPPKKVRGLRVASRGGADDEMDALGCPVEYIDLRGTTFEKPAVCKYTGNKYYSDDWFGGGGH